MSAAVGFPPKTAERIWDRDRGCCARCGRGLVRERRGDDWAIHHRAPRGQGGAGVKAAWVNRASNGVCLCNGCHAEVESDRVAARDVGWLVSRISTDRPTDTPVPHAILGVVYLDDDGGWTRA